jgi:hypothetical protein
MKLHCRFFNTTAAIKVMVEYLKYAAPITKATLGVIKQ